MRAHFIRGEDPKKTIDIGSSYLEKQKIRSINWGIDPDWLEEVLEREYYFESYKNIPLLFAYSKDLDKWMALTPAEISTKDPYFGGTKKDKLRSGWQSSKQFALRDIVNQIDKKFPDIKESYQFVRGQDPMDTMELGDVHGRKLKKIEKILIDEFRKIFYNLSRPAPEIESYARGVNIGMGNREDIETDTIIVFIEYGGYYFNLTWTGNPLKPEVPQRFEALWQKGSTKDGNSYLVLNQAVHQLTQWIKQI